MLPSSTTAASRLPSELDAMASQSCVEPINVSLVQFAPEFDDVQTLPPSATATSFVPFELDAMLCQLLSFQSLCSLLTQVSPEFEDVQMWSSG